MATTQKRGDSFQLVVTLGNDIYGKKIRKTKTFIPPKGVTPLKAEKLAKKEAEIFEMHCKGKKTLNENMRFKELVEWYFDNYAQEYLKESTIYNYTVSLNTHIMPAFGQYKLKDITTCLLTEFFKKLPLKASSIKKTHTVFSSILTCAVKQGFILENPCRNVFLPRIDKEEKAYLSENNVLALLSLVDKYSIFNTIIKTLIYTGMRSGECLALKWSDIDFKNNVISVNHTLTYISGKYFLSQPKTKKSIRSIKVPKELISVFKIHKKEQMKMKLKMGGYWENDDIVFTTETGHFYDRSYLNKAFKKIVKQYNENLYKDGKRININEKKLPQVSIHDLRHCNATMLINSGIPLKIVSEHLGHSNINTTADIYGHVLESSKSKIANVLEFKLHNK